MAFTGTNYLAILIATAAGLAFRVVHHASLSKHGSSTASTASAFLSFGTTSSGSWASEATA